MLPHVRATGSVRHAGCARSFGLELGYAPSPEVQREMATMCAGLPSTAPYPIHLAISSILCGGDI